MAFEEGQQDPGLMPGTMVGEFRIERLVGEGGMGQVYGAVHPVIGKRAAIKVLLPDICRNREMVERFVMEARSVNQIGHPNIVDVFAFGTLPDGRQYMVMEWLRGESLSDRLHRGIPALVDTCDIVLGVAAALDAAHEKGIIHRDLKPHNVYLVEVKSQKPLVKLLDFGLVKLMGPEDDGRVERTRSGSVLGTPAYMSPEQALGRSVDARSDNYSLGVLAFQMLTGRLPFLEDTAMGLMVAHMQQPPTMPSAVAPNIPPELDQLVLALLAKDPGQRPTLMYTMEVLTYVRDAYGPGHRSGSMTPRPSMPLAPSAPTWAPPNHQSATTIGRSQGEQVLTARREPRSSWKLAMVGVVVVAAAAVAMVLATRGGDDKAVATPPAAPLDAAIAVTVPADAALAVTTPPDAAVVLTPVDAAAVVAAPGDAAEVAVTIDAGVAATTTTGTKPPKPQKPKVPRVPKPPGNGSATTTKPPPPDDDDGLLQVHPKTK